MATEARGVTLNAFRDPARRLSKTGCQRETLTGHGAHNFIRDHGWSVLKFPSPRPDWSIQTKKQ